MQTLSVKIALRLTKMLNAAAMLLPLILWERP